MYTLVTLGRLSLEHGGAPVAGLGLPRKPLAILAVLAAEGLFSRDRLMVLFWPESDAARARGSLKQALHQLRQQLGASDLLQGSAVLRLNPSIIQTDVAQFLAALDAGDLASATALYGGPFLDGVILTGVELQHWVDARRADLARRWERAVEQLALAAEREGDMRTAAERWRQLQDASPADSRVALRLMHALNTAGQRAAALEHARVHERSLRVEWDLPPDPAVVALALRFRSEAEASAASMASRMGSAAASGLDADPVLHAGVPEPSVTPIARLHGASRVRWRVLAACAAILIIVMGASRASRGRGVNADPDLLVIAPFHAVDTSLAVWREGLADVLTRSLDGAGPIRTVRGAVAYRDWQGQANRAAGDRLGARMGAGLVLYGSVARLGRDSVALGASVLDRGTGIAADVEVRGSEGQMDNLADSLAVHILKGLGRGRPIAAAPRVSLVAHSLPALREFLRAEQFYRRNMVDSALAHYDQALVQDPDLAMARRRMATLIASNVEAGAAYGSAAHQRRLAIELRKGLAPRDSMLLLADSLELETHAASTPDAVGRNVHARVAVLEEAARRFPYDVDIWTELGEARYHGAPAVGSSAESALHAFERAIVLDPGFAPAYYHAIELALRLRQTDRAADFARSAAKVEVDPGATGTALVALVLDSGMGSPAVLRALRAAAPRALMEAGTVHLAWATDSADAAIAVVRELAARNDPAGGPMAVDPVLRWRYLALALAFRGRFEEAAALGLTPSSDPRAAGYDAANDPFTELALFGFVPDTTASRAFSFSLQPAADWGRVTQAPTRRHLRGAPWWFAKRDTVALQRFAARAAQVTRGPAPPTSVLRGRYLHAAATAYLTLARGDSVEALRLLRAIPDTLCLVAECFHEKLALARLLAASGDDRQAAQVYQRWIAAAGFGTNTPSAVLAALEHARVAERLGDTGTALTKYQFVAEVWRSADSILQPQVAEARAGALRLAAAGKVGTN